MLSLATATTPAAAPDTALSIATRQVFDLECDPRARTWSAEYLATLSSRAFTPRLECALDGATVSRVEVRDARGDVEVLWGMDDRGVLTVEPRRTIAPGEVAIALSYLGELRASGAGLVCDSARTRVTWNEPEGHVVPRWRSVRAASRWDLLVRAPGDWRVTASLPLVSNEPAESWRTWSFRSRRALRAGAIRWTLVRAGPVHKSAAAKREGRP